MNVYKLSFCIKIMYSDTDIKKAVKEKKIKINPFDKNSFHPNSYRLHLDSILSVPVKAKVDPIKTSTSKYKKIYKEKRADGFVLKPRDFALARTKEKISIDNSLCGFIYGRTTLARLGMSVTQTAPVIHSGHGVPKPRKIILEISNAGCFDIVLKKGMNIANLSFFENNSPSISLYDKISKYGKRKNIDEFIPVKS